ncbi:MAG: threonine/serine exporter family protein [Wenzhouxiangella sp.]|nr:threonine/serine exporter family protein [Wenzhouxiangella sp.]
MSDDHDPSTTDDAHPYETSSKARLVINLGRALLHVGSPSHRLEEAMAIMARRLGLTAEFFSTPTALLVSLGDQSKQQTFLARSEPGSANLAKLADLTEVMSALANNEMTPEQADQRVHAIDAQAPLYGWGWQLLGFLILGAGIAPILGGGLKESLLAMMLGLIVGTAVLTLRRHVERSRLITPLASALVTFLGTLWCGFDPTTALLPAVTASIITLLPGMDLTVAARELATGHVVSGSSRLAFGLTVLALLGLGMVVGSLVAQTVVGPVPLGFDIERVSWMSFAGLGLAAAGLMLLNQAHKRDWPWMLLACVIAWIFAGLGDILSSPVVGAFLGGLAVGMAGNLFVLITGRPGSIMHIPGLIVLVPGSIGFRSVTALLGDDVVMGIETGFLTAIIAIALTTGMMLSSVLLPPQKTVL